MGVLDVVDGVLHRLTPHQFEVEGGRLVDGRHQAQKPEGVGPATATAGFVWAVIQPYRITLLHPDGQGFWWLVAEPPLWVLLVGLAFARYVAPGLIEDLDAAEG